MSTVTSSTINTITNPVPNPELINIDLLTTTVPDSTGVFDELMTSVNNHLTTQFEKDRITGEQFGKVYVEAMGQAMQTAVSFILAKETANQQNKLINEQIYSTQLDNSRKIEEVLSQQKQNAIIDKQLTLYDEQIDAERGKTKDTLLGGGTISGTIAIEKQIKQAQKTVYDAQAASFILDGKYKTAQLYSSAHIASRTQDTDLSSITNFNNTNVDLVMSSLKTASGL